MSFQFCFSPDRIEPEEPVAIDELRPYYDESEEDLRADQILLKDQWRSLFDQFDPEGFGEIPWTDFFLVLTNPAFKEQVSDEKIDRLLELAYQYSSTTSAITFQQFINVMSGKRTSSFKYAVHCRDRQLYSRQDFHLIEDQPLFSEMKSMVSREMLADPRDQKYYRDIYRGEPGSLKYPELGDTTIQDLTLDSVISYCPKRSLELWRYLSYFIIHNSWWHLSFNLSLQCILGLPLEMVHGSIRLAVIYMAGVLAGSLVSGVLDPYVCLVGASGGVYSLISAYLSHILMNYNTIDNAGGRLVVLLLVASIEVGIAIYGRYADGAQISFLAHIGGTIAGITIGQVVLNNFQQKLWEHWSWWLCFSVYLLLGLAAICTIIYRQV